MVKVYQPSFVYIDHKFQKDKAIVTEKNKIVDILNPDEAKQKYGDREVVDGTGEIMIPGSINAHNHSFQSLLRGIAADKPFLEWRDQSLYKYSPYLKAEDVYTGAAFAFSEMMKYGATTVCDYFYVHNEGLESDEAIIRAAKDVGIRLVLARTMYDWNGAPSGYVETVDQAVKNVKHLAVKYQADDVVSIVPAPHSLHAASTEMVKAGHRLAQELDTKFHIHVAEEPFEVEQVQRETGMRPVEWLEHIGVMKDGRMAAIHCVWLNENEKNIMAENQAQLIYCPSSNMFLSDGITDIPALMKKGVTIGLGSDGACSNNRISVFEEMRMCALLQKVHTLDSLAVTYEDVFKMGTLQGAEILDIPAGKIKKGYLADFVFLKMNDFSMQPISGNAEQILPNIVYSMQPSAISKVVVNGVERVSDGVVLSMPEEQTIQKVVKLMNRMEVVSGRGTK